MQPKTSSSKQSRFHSGAGGSAVAVVIHRGYPRTRIRQIHPDKGLVEIELATEQDTNQALLTYLEAILQVKPEALAIAIDSSKGKIISVTGLPPLEVSRRLHAAWQS